MLIPKIKNYFKDKDYSLNICENKIYINNYKKIDYISDNLLIIIFDNFILHIKGHNFTVDKMIDKEALFNGSFQNIEVKNK